ncbi:MAG: phosphodiester glycosidase family protein [Chloroflexota bacterium]
MYQRVLRLLHGVLLIIVIGTCLSIMYYIRKAASAVPEPIPTPTLVSSLSNTEEKIADTDWSGLHPGLEERVIDIYVGQNQHAESIHIWRLDQKYFRMDVAFDEKPKSLETWQKETDAALVMNGGYFSIENEKYFPDGLTILQGEARGQTFDGFGGMLAIKPDHAELRWLVEQPYNSNERLQAALQSFPMLVKPGGELGFGTERENYAKARRTVIAQDQDGRILFIVAPLGYFTLHQLSVYLTESDLRLDIAVNLDGGGSTGILVTSPREIIPSRVLLPFVILVYAR